MMGLCHPPVPAVCPALRPCAPWATVVESGLGRRVCAIRPALGKRETVLPLLTIPWWLRTPSGKRPTAGEGGSSGSRRTHSTGQTAARAPIRPGLVLRSTGPPDRNPPARPHPRRVSFSLKFRSRAGGRGGRAVFLAGWRWPSLIEGTPTAAPTAPPRPACSVRRSRSRPAPRDRESARVRRATRAFSLVVFVFRHARRPIRVCTPREHCGGHTQHGSQSDVAPAAPHRRRGGFVGMRPTELELDPLALAGFRGAYD